MISSNNCHINHKYIEKGSIHNEEHISIFATGYSGPKNPISTKDIYKGKYYLNISNGKIFKLKNLKWKIIDAPNSYYFLDLSNKIWKYNKSKNYPKEFIKLEGSIIIDSNTNTVYKMTNSKWVEQYNSEISESSEVYENSCSVSFNYLFNNTVSIRNPFCNCCNCNYECNCVCTCYNRDGYIKFNESIANNVTHISINSRDHECVDI